MEAIRKASTQLETSNFLNIRGYRLQDQLLSKLRKRKRRIARVSKSIENNSKTADRTAHMDKERKSIEPLPKPSSPNPSISEENPQKSQSPPAHIRSHRFGYRQLIELGNKTKKKTKGRKFFDDTNLAILIQDPILPAGGLIAKTLTNNLKDHRSEQGLIHECQKF